MSTVPHSTSQEALLAQQAFLRRLARSLVADEHRAEDLAQEAALEALRAGPERLGAMRAWLRRVVQNLATDASRREQRRVAREERALPPPPPPGPDELVQRLQVQRRVLEALEHLDEPYRATLFLRYWDDLPPSVIAERTGVPVSTVKSRLARGLARLRAELDEGHGGERQAWAVALAAGFDGWERTTLGAAAATGGIAMSVKLALGGVAVCAVITGTWWAIRSPPGPGTRESVASATHVDGVASSALRVPRGGQRAAVAVEPLTQSATAAAHARPEWLLELEIRGQHPADSGPLSVVVRVPGTDARSVELTQPLRETSCRIDVGPLFSLAEEPRGADASGADPLRWLSSSQVSRPGVLRLVIDHPHYLPLEANVLVPEELRRPEMKGGRLTAQVELERAKACVTGTVALESGDVHPRLRVALHAMQGDAPAVEPVERVRPAANGSFRLRASSASEHIVVAYMELDTREPSGLRPETRPVSLAAGETHELEPIVVGAGAAIAGQVAFLDSGKQLPGHVQMHLQGPRPVYLPQLKLVWAEGRFETWNANVPWDEQGRFHITGLAPRVYSLVPIVRGRGDVPTLSTSEVARGQAVTAPASDVRLPVEGLRITFLVKDRTGAPRRALLEVALEEGAWPNAKTTDDEGRICVVLDPSRGVHCRVDDFVHVPTKAYFAPHLLAGGGPIEITLDDVEPAQATLAIRKGPRARKLSEGVLLDVLFYDRSNERALSFLKDATHTITSSRAVAQVVLENRQPRMKVRDDGTQIVSELQAASYVVVLSPRSVDPARACLLLPTEIEIELHAGERVEHEWEPEVGGALRVNFSGSGAREASFCDLEGQRLMRWQTGDDLSGVRELQDAVPAGPYALHVRMKDGRERIVPVRIEADRVNDVEIDVGAL